MATKMKSEPPEREKNKVSSENGHCHSFYWKFDGMKPEQITCTEAGTILRALESSDDFLDFRRMNKEDMKKEEDESKASVEGNNFVIKCDKGYIVKHFPCWLVKEEDTLTITAVRHNIDETTGQHDEETESYVTFTVETKGGKKTTSKEILKNKNLKCYGPLCVYAKAMEKVEQGLRNDGRFADIVFEQKCQLSERLQEKTVSINQMAKKLHGRNFEICLTKPRRRDHMETSVSTEETSLLPEDENTALLQSEIRSDSDYRQMSQISDAGEQSSKTKEKRQYQPMPDYAEIKKILDNQFADLVKHMENRRNEGQKKTFPEELSLIQENFGKIRQKFSEVYLLKKLLKLGGSVCQVTVEGGMTGTGFVLFDNFILTNAHLFDKNVTENLDMLVKVCVKFNYEGPKTCDVHLFNVKKKLIDLRFIRENNVLDYAILEIDQIGKRKRKKKVPPGLLCEYGPVPTYGGACLIGHPGGEVKQIEPTSIIGCENREEAVDKYRRDNMHPIFTINDQRSKEKLRLSQLMNDKDNYVTYHTSFLHGASGSPVFDHVGRVFGIHTGGFPYQDPHTQTKQSVIEYALPLEPILKSCILRLKEENKHEVLSRFKEEAQKNSVLKSLIDEEPMDWN